MCTVEEAEVVNLEVIKTICGNKHCLSKELNEVQHGQGIKGQEGLKDMAGEVTQRKDIQTIVLDFILRAVSDLESFLSRRLTCQVCNLCIASSDSSFEDQFR